MKTIQSRTITKEEIKKSIFIAIIERVDEKKEVSKLLEKIKIEYPNATHYCYAYIIDQEKHSSDDKEPARTAGMPILNVLEKQNLNHICCIVIRYFGGIKLGSGGLVRAYSNIAQKGIKASLFVEYESGLEIEITIPYEQQKQLEYLLKEATIMKKSYQENITYRTKISLETEKTLQKNKIPYIIIKSCFIPKTHK